MTLRDPALSAAQLSRHLQPLEAERQLVLATPLANDAHYMADLNDEITAARSAHTAAAVSEIARRRAELQRTAQHG